METCSRPDASVAYRIWGEGPLLIALHGFTHDSSTWSDLARRIQGCTVAAPDLRGHGATVVERNGRIDLVAAGEDVVALADDLGVDRFDVVGYSMGARVALHTALAEPKRVRSLCLVGCNPGIEDEAARRTRARSDTLLASKILSDGVDAFAAEWEQKPMFAGLRGLRPQEQAELAAVRRSHDGDQLAGALSGMTVGRQANLWPSLPALQPDIFVVTGEFDTRYVEWAERIRMLRPDAVTAVVPGCGHTVHLEAPAEFAALVSDWLGSPRR